MSAKIHLLVLLLASASVLAAPTRTPEEEAARLSKVLKPIPDEQWKTIAGERISEKYEVVKGDTLFDISKRLFGDGKYWPKVWALNNAGIGNPHVIKPGAGIAFLPGTGSALPAVLVAAAGASSANDRADRVEKNLASDRFPGIAGRSQEWRNLKKQPWENITVQLPPEVDAQGFDTRNKINFRKVTGFDLDAIAETAKIPMLGKIIGSRNEASYLSIGDTVYVAADEDLQIGEVYALTQEPAVLKSRKSDRTGFSYIIVGKVKIVGVRDGMFIGTILTHKFLAYRGGTFLMKLPPKIRNVTPIPGPRPIEGVLMTDRTFSTYTSAQHKLIFVDRGTDEGVKPGMVFRAYQHYDPSTEKKLTDSDFIIDADILVLQCSERFSIGMVISSHGVITENSTVVLLTDISDLLRNRGFRDRSPEEKERDRELDDLEKLDGGGGLGRDEQKELQQLEQWKENPAGAPPADSAPLPPPAETPLETPPPPPASDAPPALEAPLEPAPEATPTGDDALPPAPPSGELAPATEVPPPPAAPTASEPAPPPLPPPPSEGAPISDESKGLDNLLNQ